MAAWDRQDDEPPKAYDHFCVYRDFGPHRTLAKASPITGCTEGTLKQYATDYRWTPRCDQWDAHVQAIHDRAFLTETAKKGRERARAFSKLLGRCLEALEKVDVEKVSLIHIANALRVASEGLRLEEGLETSRVTMELNDARQVLSRLPAEVREPLVAALASRAKSPIE